MTHERGHLLMSLHADGGSDPWWYVAYNEHTEQIIVGHQGANFTVRSVFVCAFPRELTAMHSISILSLLCSLLKHCFFLLMSD